MSDDKMLVTAACPFPDGAIAGPVPSAMDYARSARADSTRRAYASDWRRFDAWCKARGLSPLPASPKAAADYITELANRGQKVATVARALAAIAKAHELCELPSPRRSPAVRSTLDGISRRLGVAQLRKAPLCAEELRTVLASLPNTLLGMRDRSLLSLGWMAALRRAELVALEVVDLEFTSEGVEVTIRRSKTDQHGHGEKLGVPLAYDEGSCPVRALGKWLKGAGITEGPVFRAVDRHGNVGSGPLGDRVVAIVVKRSVAAIGLDPAAFAGHSLRAGFVTSAVRAGKSDIEIRSQTRHRTPTMVDRYRREESLFLHNAASGLL